MSALDVTLYRRAAARCTTVEPHREAGEEWPCSGCLLAAATQLAIAAGLGAR